MQKTREKGTSGEVQRYKMSRRERSHRWKEADVHKEEDTERHTMVSFGITGHCNRLESRQLGSVQVSLAADFPAVSLPTTAHGNMILQ